MGGCASNDEKKRYASECRSEYLKKKLNVEDDECVLSTRLRVFFTLLRDCTHLVTFFTGTKKISFFPPFL